MTPSGKTPEEFVTIVASDGVGDCDESTPCWKHLLNLLDDADPLDYLNVFEIEITSSIERERAAEDRWDELKEKVQTNVDATTAELKCFSGDLLEYPKGKSLSDELFRLNLFKKWMSDIEEK